ncbi:MAG: hypothetical protein ACTTKY_00615 [Catonella sp.]
MKMMAELEIQLAEELYSELGLDSNNIESDYEEEILATYIFKIGGEWKNVMVYDNSYLKAIITIDGDIYTNRDGAGLSYDDIIRHNIGFEI